MKRLIILIVIVVVLGGVVVGLLFVGRKPAAITPVNLTYWGVFDDPAAFNDAIALYRAKHPYVTITYKKFRLEEYEDELLRGWAKDAGPDIFSIPAPLLRKYDDFTTPLPKQTEVYDIEIVKKLGIISERQVTKVTTPSVTVADLKSQYIDLVANDVVRNGEIVALPLGIDTLVLYYNKDHLNSAAIPEPPATWSEFLLGVPRLTVVDQTGKIIRAGAALGTSANVNRAVDILALLMLQSGVEIVDATGTNARLTLPSPGNPNELPSERALTFYTDFARPTKSVFTWDATQLPSLDAFAQGKVSFFFGYQYMDATIKARATNLNYAVAAVPQLTPDRKVNVANFWVEAVAKKSKHPNEAWDFVQSLGSPDVVKTYLAKSGKTPVLRSLLTPLVSSSDLTTSVLATQALTAKSWYRGYNLTAAEEALAELIDVTLAGTKTAQEAVSLANAKIQQTLRKTAP